MIRTCRILCSLLLAACCWTERTVADIKPDGMCNVVMLAPFVSNDRKHEMYGLSGKVGANLGFLQLATALLAVRHFNSRNASIVPEIANISSSCNVKLNISKVFNAVPGDYSAIRWLANNSPPCAIAGGNDDYTGNEVRVTAKSFSIPVVTSRTFDPDTASDDFVSTPNPNLEASASRILQYLLFKNRTNYISLIYEESTVNLKRRESIVNLLDKMNIDRYSVSFSATQPEMFGSPYSAMKRVKDRGYRTVIIAQDNPLASYRLIADAAEALGMNRGGYFYVWYDLFEPSVLWETRNDNATKLIAGSAWIRPLFNVPPATNQIWSEQSQDNVNSVVALNPFGPGELGYVQAIPDFFKKVSFTYSCALVYDAIMSIGIGACKAQSTNGTKFVSGSDHQRSIRGVDFRGFSGHVTLVDGSRSPGTVVWTAVNFLANETYYTCPEEIVPTELPVLGNNVTPTMDTGAWVSGNSFVYADGTSQAPPLRDSPEQNYLPAGVRTLGLLLMVINTALAMACAGWVFIRRKHRILAASQPEFLYLICLGSFVQSSAILPSSFDESHGWSVQQLDAACMAIPWLFTVGYMIVYSSLFSKLWRVNKVLQFSRRRIKIRHVVWPMVILLVLEVLLLILWTVLDPLQWERVEVNSVTGESVGSCDSNNTFAFVAALVIVMLVPSLLTLLMAWKTKDVDETFTESRWIFVLILLQIEVTLVAIPVLVILSSRSSSGKYLGELLFFFAFPMSTLGLIFVPKIVAYRRAVRGGDGLPRFKRGQRGNGRVSGVQDGPTQTDAIHPSHISGVISTGPSEKHSMRADAHSEASSVAE